MASRQGCLEKEAGVRWQKRSLVPVGPKVGLVNTAEFVLYFTSECGNDISLVGHFILRRKHVHIYDY